jgi:FMN-dependent oxidoreductase (nitrilotriacetate monooxygenase family)
MSKARRLHLAAFGSLAGNHIASWLHPDAAASELLNASYYKGLAEIAERGLFDLIFFPDILAVTQDRVDGAFGNIAHGVPYRAEPLTTMALLAGSTKRIGLVGTASTSHNEPFNVARQFAFLDHLSEGRVGWNIVTTASEAEANNFGANLSAHSSRYARAGEFVDVVKKLWNSWDADAVQANKKSGVYADSSKVRAIHHRGEFFSVEGPLNVPRSPQGQPVLFQAGASDVGRDFAAKTADAVFFAAQTRGEAEKIGSDIRALAQKHGRSSSEIRLLPGVLIFVGKTEEEAKEKQAALGRLLKPEVGRALLFELLGVDFTKYDLDERFPALDIETVPGIQSRYTLLKAMADREQMTLRQVIERVASAAGHRVIAGTPQQVADELLEWFDAGIVDGYAVMWPYLPGSLNDFVDLVVPELQRRGAYPTEYIGLTLRDHLGLS